MRSALALLSIWLLAGGGAAHAGGGPLNCAKKSLSDAVRRVKIPNRTISFTGVCNGPIVIGIDGLTLVGVDTAVIDGGGEDAVTIEGASRVSLMGVEVRNGLNGIVVARGAHVALGGVSSHDNAMAGIVVRSSSTAAGTGVTASANAGNGLAADDGASITLSDSTFTANGVKDILLTFGSRADLGAITFGTYACDATVLVRGSSGIVCPH